MSRGRGWHRESLRHSLAARGISTTGGLSRIKEIDDLPDFLEGERLDMARDQIDAAKYGITRDRRNLARMRDIDQRILQAMNDDELDLAEILIESKAGEPGFNLRASGVLSKIREKFSGKKSDLPLINRQKEYRAWYEKEFDKRKRSLASSPSEFHDKTIQADFVKRVAQKRTQYALTDADVAKLELSVHSLAKSYPITERAKVQRQRAAIRPMKMSKTSAAIQPYVSQEEVLTERPPSDISEVQGYETNLPAAISMKFGEMDRKNGETVITVGPQPLSPITHSTDARDLVLSQVTNEPDPGEIAKQEAISESLSRQKSKAKAEYFQELKRNRKLRSDVGTAMQEEWDIMGDEIALREQTIDNAERAMAAGGVFRGSGCLPTNKQSRPLYQPSRPTRRRIR